jgi:hypothetical protein
MAGTNYSADKAAYNAQINTDITTEVDPNTISPDMVGSGYTDLADLLEPYINRINDQDLFFGTDDPTTVPDFGQDLDLYYQQVNPIGIWRKEAGVWTLKGTIPIDFVLPEGNLTVQTNIDGFQVLATRGGWVINNTMYQKATQTLMTADAADLNFYRYDIIYGTTTNQVLYQVGIASATPVAPTLPADTILIDQLVVPSSASGFDPYLLFGGSGVNNLSAEDVILNQSGTPQVGASFNIDGSGKIGTTLELPGIPTNDVSDYNLTINALGEVRRSTVPVGTGLAAEASTGALTYAGISVVDASHVNIGACTGYVVDNESNPSSPTVIAINYAGETNKLVTTLGSGQATYVLLNSLGTIVFQNAFPTSAQRKTHIYLSKISHPSGSITVAGDEVDFITSPLSQFRDLFQSIQYINNGVTASANGANLTFNTSTGVVTGDGINFVADNTNPNDLTVAPQTPCTFLPRTRTGAGGAATTIVDVSNYDVAGVVTAIPGGANVSTLRYIFLVPGLGFIVQYGQVTYSSLTDAVAAVGKEAFVIYPSLVRNAILIGVLAATKSATALNNTAQALFFRADKFGQSVGSSAGISTGTLQTDYNNSLQPQITTTTALGAVQFKRGSAADTNNVFQVLNGAGTSTFSATGEGAVDIAKSEHVGGTGYEESSVSPTITGHQGYAYDGTYHYITDTARIDKRNNDGTWSIALTNNTPFAGVAGVNHLGDPSVSGGVLYVPAETYAGCGSVSGQKILTFNTTTLALINQYNISAQGHEASGIAIDAVNNIAYVSSYCDGSQIWRYNATTFAFLSAITLERSINGIQGVSYYNGLLYIASQYDGIYTCDPSTGSISLVLDPENAFLIPEGIDVVSGQIRWLIDNVGDGSNSSVYFYNPSTDPMGFYTNKSGISSFGGDLSVGRRLNVFTDTVIGSVNIGTMVGYQSALYMENGTNTAALTHDFNTTGLSRNAYILAGVWTRSDITKPSFSLVENEVTNQYQFRSASAAANPITWSDVLTIERASGKITIPASTEGVFNGTGATANEQTCLIKNTTTTSAGAYVAVDNIGNKFASFGVLNSATTLGVAYGLAGEVFVRSSAGAAGLHHSAAAGPMRFSVSSGTEAMRIFSATRNISIGNTTDSGFKLDVTGTSRISGVETLQAGAEALKVGTNTGNPDHAYMGFYARTASPTTRSGFLGYISAGSSVLALQNDIAAGGVLITTGTTGSLQVTADACNFFGNSLAGGSIKLGSVSSDNALLIEAALGNRASGANVTLRTNSSTGSLSGATTLNTNTLGRYSWGGYITTAANGSYNSASILGLATENWSSTAGGSKLEIYTTPNTTVAQAKAAEWANDGSFLYKFASAAADPTSTEIPAGFVKLYKNTGSGVLKLWANDGGTLKSVTLT